MTGNRALITALVAGVGLLVLGVTFWAGVTVGARRPNQAPPFPFGRPFGDPRGDMAHGAFGSITRIDGDSITITDPRLGQPRTINVIQSTLIERGNRQPVRIGDLRVGDNITVIGTPMNGNMIQARFVGVVDQPPMNFEWFHAPPRFGPDGSPPSRRGIGGSPGRGA